MSKARSSIRIQSPTLARLPPLVSLRVFVAAARHLSFARAAEELHVSPTAVGQQIRILEDYLGEQLFHRNAGQLRLTAAGRILVPGLTEAFDGVLEACFPSRDASMLARRGAGPPCSMNFLAVEQCHERHAERCGDLPEKIDRRRALASFDLTEHGAAYAREFC